MLVIRGAYIRGRAYIRGGGLLFGILRVTCILAPIKIMSTPLIFTNIACAKISQKKQVGAIPMCQGKKNVNKETKNLQ